LLRAGSTKLQALRRNRAVFNSPSRLGSGWRGRPCPRPRLRSLAAQIAAFGAFAMSFAADKGAAFIFTPYDRFQQSHPRL